MSCGALSGEDRPQSARLAVYGEIGLVGVGERRRRVRRFGRVYRWRAGMRDDVAGYCRRWGEAVAGADGSGVLM